MEVSNRYSLTVVSIIILSIIYLAMQSKFTL